ncbi:MAG TPA: type VI secretion system tip protein TssI/VgrG [Bryobacteraceae bacterium]|nr:type VI secretion system tip protein TssI/VgrG [Bryobacteraceae bacterium]
MPNVTQETRLLELTTPLGKDKLLIRSIDGMEGLSQLFSFRVEAFAPNDDVVDFSLLVGQTVCVRLVLDNADSQQPKRFFHGLVQTVTRGARGYTNTAYSLQIVPNFWTLTRTTQSRIFQQMSVPDILKKVLVGFSVSFELQGTYEPRDYCVQYRESDFDFASRLMEEEGIFYYFKHEETNHVMLVADTSTSHKELPHSPTLSYDPDVGGVEDLVIVYAWEKTQTLRSGKTTLWDHSFELPHKPLDAQELILETLQVGSVSHKLKLGGNENMELYDYPGGYAQRFDGVKPGGGDNASDLQKIFDDNKRTTKLRMQQEAVNSIVITGYTGYLGIIPGFKFTLDRHYEDNDVYTITRSHFTIPQMGGYAGDESLDAPPPEIVFNCIPFTLPFRPQRVTAKPTVYGTQTGVVVGPAGEDIFTDKYGRIKVQMLWDRSLPYNDSSSCWCRCAFPWAGKNYGFISIPRIGHEVVVAFEEGDPDQPIVVGSVYNADTMPPWTLPDNKTQSGFQTRTEKGGNANLNVLQFEDKKESEFIFIHGEKDFHQRIKNDSYSNYGRDVSRYIERNLIEEVKNEIHRMVKASVYDEVKSNVQSKVGGNMDVVITGTLKNEVTGAVSNTYKADHSEKTTGTMSLKAANIIFEADTKISFKVGGSEVVIDSSSVSIKGSSKVAITGGTVNINSGPGTPAGSPTAPAAAKVTAPKAITPAMEPGQTGKVTYTGGSKQPAGPAHNTPPTGTKSPAEKAAQSGQKDPANENHFIEIQVNDEDNLPVPGEYFEVLTPEGTVASGTTDEKGFSRIDGIQPGTATIRFPNRDKTVLE